MEQASPIQVDVSLAAREEKLILRHLLELYAYDFSAFDGADVDSFGLYGYERLDHYWTEPNRFPFLFRIAGRLAGFALVRRATLFPEQLDATSDLPYSLAEFFILRKYRRQGAGRAAAFHLFDRFPGRWEVAEIAENPEAIRFWRAAIGAYTGEHFTEYWLDTDQWKGPVQVFQSPAHSAPA